VARREQLLPITVVGERSRLANQPVNDVPVVETMLVTATQPRQMLDQLLCVPHFEVLYEETDLDLLADQATGHRVTVAVDVDQAAAIDARHHTLASLQAAGRQGLQPCPFLGQSLAPPGIELHQQLPQERGVVLAPGEVPAATQHQRLIDGALETPVPLLDVTVLVGLAGLNLLARYSIVGQQCLITLAELLLLGEVVDSRAQAIGAMALRHAAQLDERVLQAFAQSLEALRKADRRRLPVRVGQHEMVDQVVEALPLDGDTQVVHRGEIRGTEPAGLVDLGEEDLLGWAGSRAPATDVPLQGAQLVVGEASRPTPLQLLENGLGLEAGIRFEELAHHGPDLLEGVGPRPPGVRFSGLTRPLPHVPVFACGLFVHVRPPRRPRQRLAVSQQAEQLQDLLVRDHRNPPCAKKLRLAYRQLLSGKSNCRSPATVLVAAAAIIVVRAGNLIVVRGRNNCR
jgi:hypothetical protein